MKRFSESTLTEPGWYWFRPKGRRKTGGWFTLTARPLDNLDRKLLGHGTYIGPFDIKEIEKTAFPSSLRTVTTNRKKK